MLLAIDIWQEFLQAFRRRQKRIRLTTTTTAAVNQTALNRLNGLNIFNYP